MQNAGNTAIQFQAQKLLFPSIQQYIFFYTALSCADFLCRRNQINQNLFCLYCLSHKQMTQIAFMTHAMVKRNLPLSEVFHSHSQNLTVIIIHDLASIYRHNIIKTAALMHTKCQRTIFDFISKSIFHFVTIAALTRTFTDSFKNIFGIRHHHFHQFQYLSGF